MKRGTYARLAVAALTLAMALGLCAAPAAAVVRATAGLDVGDATVKVVPFSDSGTLTPPDKIDEVYAVDLMAGQTIGVVVNGASGTNFVLLLYPPGTTTVVDSSAYVAVAESNASDTAVLSYTVPTSGTYYVDVYCNPEGSPGGTYDISATTAVSTAITINASPTSVKYPKTFVLSGALTPGILHDPCGVEVKKPGSARWSYSSARLAYAESGPSALWWYRYAPKLKGVYYFRVKFLPTVARLGSTSRTIPVTVRR
jgi:hypothetical protein